MLNSSQFSVEDQDIHDPNQYKPKPHYPPPNVMDRGPNKQGELFQRKPYKHGYGPERSARVDAALEQIGGLQTTGDFDVDRAAKNEIVRSLKRSTVPAEHIASLGSISAHSEFPPQNYGLYHPMLRHVQLNTASGMGYVPEMTQHTVTHEIGHHVAWSADPHGQNAMLAGEREAHADVYAAKHTRGVYSPEHMYDRSSIETVASMRNESPYESRIKYMQEIQRHGIEPHHTFHSTAEVAEARTRMEQMSPNVQERLF